tara:strand:- start:590 stop:1477 length:888 start_codon:yes stop_codon:yes gene_type:complete
MRQHYLLINPKGGYKKGLEIFERVRDVFRKANTKLTVLHTKYAGHAFDLANTLDFNKHDGLCAIGGDGTMYEMINGMLKRKDKKKIPIGLITGGTGNSFMYDVECLDPVEAARRIVKYNLRPLDIAKVDANGELFYAFNIVGWGLATDAGKLAEKLRWLGGMRYNIASVIEVLKGKNRIANLKLGKEEIKDNFIFVIGCNTIHTGKAMKMAPLAKLDDGKIDLLIVRKTSRVNLLKLFPKLFSGEHVKSPLVEYRQVENFSISIEETNDLTIDGEIIGTTPLNVQIIPNMVNVLV